MHYAVKYENLELIKFLVKNLCQINAKDLFGYTPLHYAVLVNNIDIVNCLLDNGANVNAQGYYDLQSPLHLASQKDYYHICKLLLKWNTNISLKNDESKSPIDLVILL